MASKEETAWDNVDFREGYAQGLREGVAVFERMAQPFMDAGHSQFGKDLSVVVAVARRKTEEWLDERMMP